MLLLLLRWSGLWAPRRARMVEGSSAVKHEPRPKARGVISKL